MYKDNPGKYEGQVPLVCFDSGGLRGSIMSILRSIVDGNVNVPEVLWIINHIQYKTLLEASVNGENGNTRGHT